MPNSDILAVRNLSKYFKKNEIHIANNINFSVKEGEIFTILGKSGSGKTTILRMIAGLETPNSGEITICDKTVFDKNIDIEPNKRDIAIVFQNYALLPHLSVKDNITFGVKFSNEELNIVIAKTRLENAVDKYPHELSGGQQQRVALARAMIKKPKILLLDEPLSNIDTELRASLRIDLKSTIKEFGITALFITHDKEDAFYLSDKIAIINSGDIVQIGTAKEIYENPKNLYCANFFGKMNELGSEILKLINFDSNKKVFIRPEHISISKQGNLKSIVKDIIFYGNFYEIFLEVANQILIIHSFECDCEIGDTLLCDININKIHFL